MVKNVVISLNDDEFDHLKKLKAKRTWREVLKDGAEKHES
jgi:hypothetical protein